MQVELAHAMPGRVRLRVGGPDRIRHMRALERVAASIPGARQVIVSPVSGSLLVTFDPRVPFVPTLLMGLRNVPGAEVAATADKAAAPAIRRTAGLSAAEVQRRQAQYGPNAMPARPVPPLWRRFLGQFTDLSSVVLLAGTTLSLLTGRTWEVLVVGAAAGLNALIGAWREGHEDAALSALREMTPPHATVVRDGRVRTVAAAELVPGDLVLLQAGDRAPADVLVSEQADLEPGDRHLPIGTEVQRGHAEAVVVATGAATRLGRIAQTLGRTEPWPSPVHQRASRLGRDLLKMAAVALGLMTGIGLLRGVPPAQLLQSGISLAAASVPEGLPTYITLALAAGARRLSRRGAYVQDLSVAAGVGAVDVICTDKTGSLTRGEMTVRTVFTGGHWWSVTGAGFDLQGRFAKAGREATPLADPDMRAFLEVAARCNNAAVLEDAAGQVEIKGSQTEGALLVLALKAGLPRGFGREPRLEEESFDPARRRMTLTLGLPGAPFTCSKGAPEAILPACNRMLADGEIQLLDDDMRTQVRQAVHAMTRNGERVLAMGYAYGDDARAGLIFAGLAGIVDPPRRELRPVISRLGRQGIRTVMLTGDHPETAMAVAHELGMLQDRRELLTGDQLAGMSDMHLDRIVRGGAVFARVTPGQKARVIRALQRRGATVAYIGDGIDDAPAVRAADVGVVPHSRGSDVTREAAGLILTDERFEALVTAIEQGRATAHNADNIARYLLTTNTAELLLLAGSAVFGMPLALLPLQLLWLNLIGDGPAALALGERHAPPGQQWVRRRPIIKTVEREILVNGLAMGAAVFGLYASTVSGGGTLPMARTMAFSALASSQILYLFRCRTALGTPCGLRFPTEPGVAMAAAASGLLLLATMYFPPLVRALGTAPLTMGQWLTVAGVALAANLTSVAGFSLRQRAPAAAPV